MSAEHKTVAPAPLNKCSFWKFLRNGPLRVAIVGSGNWGTAVARIIGQNTSRSFVFESKVNMYVYEEQYQGKKLTDVINTTHENPKYLPGVQLPVNIHAEPDLRKAVAGAHILVFVVPHQFIQKICSDLQGHIVPGCKAISLTKGFDCENGKINLMSEYIRSTLGIECSALSGANVAKDIAEEQFAEATIGYEEIESAHLFQQLFHTPYFRVNAVPDVAGVEICGALKNVVALAAGFVDGLKLGSNTKAAILRLGLVEMKRFAQLFYPGTIEETFWESCGVADLITTCYGGRNRMCAELFVKSGMSWREIEQNTLKGQKLQGVHTTRDVYGFLTAHGKRELFPLLSTVYEIADCGAPASKIVSIWMSPDPEPIKAKL